MLHYVFLGEFPSDEIPILIREFDELFNIKKTAKTVKTVKTEKRKLK